MNSLAKRDRFRGDRGSAGGTAGGCRGRNTGSRGSRYWSGAEHHKRIGRFRSSEQKSSTSSPRLLEGGRVRRASRMARTKKRKLTSALSSRRKGKGATTRKSGQFRQIPKPIDDMIDNGASCAWTSSQERQSGNLFGKWDGRAYSRQVPCPSRRLFRWHVGREPTDGEKKSVALPLGVETKHPRSGENPLSVCRITPPPRKNNLLCQEYAPRQKKKILEREGG